MFKSLLIANRGEIAVRIIRTARRMGLKTIAVYSDADANAYHVAEADEAYRIGPAPAAESYLRIDAILDACARSGAEAVHPGYGFLSENAGFADACEKAGLIFVGPPASAIRAMGLKDAAKALMEKADVPVVPGYHGDNQDADFLGEQAEKIGYPVLIKAVAGGGGKGMRRVDDPASFAKELKSAQREAGSAFGDERVLVEKYVSRPRHIEIQVFADSHGQAVSLYERDCSLQRRHQKVIEEAPAPGMPPEMRKAMGEAAVAAAKAIGYRGAGTVEFIADASDGLKPDGFWFMEMNTRLQVEHPVTEAITGLDLVEWQLRVAGGEHLPLTQDKIPLRGHAVEVRLYAEDPAKKFFPSTGRLLRLRAPENMPHVRMDMGVREGDEVSMFYDPMIGKIIAHGETRRIALRTLRGFLSRMEVAGPKTNLAFLAAAMAHEAFIAGDIDTGFIDRHLDQLVPKGPVAPRVLALGTAAHLIARRAALRSAQAGSDEPNSPWAEADGWVLGGQRAETLRFTVGGETVSLTVAPEGNGWRLSGEMGGADIAVSAIMDEDGTISATVDGVRLKAACVPNGRGFILVHEGIATDFSIVDPLDVDIVSDADTGSLKSPMPGKIVQVLVEPGARIRKGAALVVMEAMKMEQTLTAAIDSVVAAVHVGVGDQVEAGATLVAFEEKPG
ncbi:acetyl/propionyl/methylcrotonyl-CoA carboxylase subunit alpha [Parvibaculum sp.]|uniref:acetyl-CoA carboxylase biotin carboxylase subunit n=1 Tax=Parvibaculum sp. TaxID=2024848 RepID=UPI002730FD41|nr:acetyl/propionyl/methylcrotonyl-CoA carboxylase subunit alpha [Parvibaculum sp.]MDP1628381.1 acetyl/propionyl/methylcrotonyl-CoA carboxylase subunit alpha [Parvibaculum sp.]MDP2149900.1 acetyl/propionyl/methylcrotonyl-CoA carboxylase subunit alpha [Parvibaculum sp.]MDP3329494.1 acetyl/propionyl/methylcrotonyl-CoA carboxylase subunit alpha [Parvibaculum sp.]